MAVVGFLSIRVTVSVCFGIQVFWSRILLALVLGLLADRLLLIVVFSLSQGNCIVTGRYGIRAWFLLVVMLLRCLGQDVFTGFGLRNIADIRKFVLRSVPETMKVTARNIEGYVTAMLKSLVDDELWKTEVDAEGISRFGKENIFRDAFASLRTNAEAKRIHNELSPLSQRFSDDRYQSVIAYSRLFKDFHLFKMIGDVFLGGAKPIMVRGDAFYQSMVLETDEPLEPTTDVSGLYTDMRENAYPVIRYDLSYSNDPRLMELGLPSYGQLYGILKDVVDFISIVIPARLMVLLNAIPCFYYEPDDFPISFSTFGGDLKLIINENAIPPGDTPGDVYSFGLKDTNTDGLNNLVYDEDIVLDTWGLKLQREKNVVKTEGHDVGEFGYDYCTKGIKISVQGEDDAGEWDGDLFENFFGQVDWDVSNMLTNDPIALIQLDPIVASGKVFNVISVYSIMKLEWLRIRSVVTVGGVKKMRWTQFNFNWDYIPRFMEHKHMYSLKLFILMGGV